MFVQPTLAWQTAVYVKSFLPPKGLDCMYLCRERNLVSHMFAVQNVHKESRLCDWVSRYQTKWPSGYTIWSGQSWLLGRGYFPYNLVTCSYLTTSHARQHSSARKRWTPNHMPMDLFDCAMISAQIFVAYWTHNPLLNKVTLANGARSNSYFSMFTPKEITTYLSAW